MTVQLTREQRVVYQWVSSELDLPVYAEAYLGAILALRDNSPGYVTLVSHVGRDILNGLAKDYNGIKRVQAQYHYHLDKLQPNWKNEWGIVDSITESNEAKDHCIPSEICQTVKDLIEDHKQGRERSNQADALFFGTFLDYENPEHIPTNFQRDWRSAKKWFGEHAHCNDKAYSQEAELQIREHFLVLDSLLYVAASSEFERLKRLNEILDDTNR